MTLRGHPDSDNRRTGRSWVRARYFLVSITIQTGSGAHPGSYTMGTGAIADRGGINPAPTSSAEVKERVQLCLCFPCVASWVNFTSTLPQDLPVRPNIFSQIKRQCLQAHQILSKIIVTLCLGFRILLSLIS